MIKHSYNGILGDLAAVVYVALYILKIVLFQLARSVAQLHAFKKSPFIRVILHVNTCHIVAGELDLNT